MRAYFLQALIKARESNPSFSEEQLWKEFVKETLSAELFVSEAVVIAGWHFAFREQARVLFNVYCLVEIKILMNRLTEESETDQ